MVFPTLTIYTVNADIATLTAILNGVAMICNSKSSMIWGFALMVSMWTLVKSITKASLAAPSGNGGSVLSGGVMAMIMPFILAMCLTNTGLQTRVQIESTIQGTVNAVDNVPFVIALVPAAASMLSQELGEVVETAFQGTGTDYGSLSSTHQGFINPLKVLLTSRTAIMKLGDVDTQVRSVVSSCLGSDSGANYSEIIRLVNNAGNTGATAAQTLDIAGTSRTAIGALLYQAAQNEVGLVPDILNANSNDLLNCSDAANKVADNITNRLYSIDFERAVIGSLNGMDNPNPGANYSFDTLTGKYDSLRQARDGLSAISQGSSQTKIETINLLFSELVSVDLDCIKADSTNKSTCQAISMQKMETERSNLQNAASVTPMLQYAGNFANFITALVIGLGPVIIMFMMFAGTDLTKNINAAVHIMVWPLLVMNVGAEIINGMIYMSVANFLREIAQGGFITQLQAIEAYKSLSINVGVASQVMASLPVLMSMIFVMGESAASVSVAKNMEPGSRDIGDISQSKITSTTPIMTEGSVAQAQFTPQSSKWGFTGAMDMVSSNATFGSMGVETSSSVTSALSRNQMISEGKQNLTDWKEAFRTGDYSRVGVDKRTGDTVRESYDTSLRESKAAKIAQGVDTTQANSNQSGAGATLGGGVGSNPTKNGVSASASINTGTNASDTKQTRQSAEKSESSEESAALVKAVSKEQGTTSTSSSGKEKNHSLEKTLATQKTYQQALSETKSNTNTLTDAIKKSDAFVSYSAKIGTNEIALQSQTNADYQRFQITQGRAFDAMPGAQGAIEKAREGMSSASTDAVQGDKRAKDAAIRHSAAVRLAQDENAPTGDRAAAVKYLGDEAKAMSGLQLKPSNAPEMKHFNIDAPTDNTRVDPVKLGVPQANPPASPQTPVKSKSQEQGAGAPTVPPKLSGSSEIEVVKKDVIDQRDPNKKLSVLDKVDEKLADAKDSGLGADGQGTQRRVGASLWDGLWGKNNSK